MVEFSLDLDGGSITNLEMVDKDTYTLAANEPTSGEGGFFE